MTSATWDIRLSYDKQAESRGRGDGMESDFRYYSRRAAEEQGRAQRAVTPEARERHHELASLFAAKAAQRLRSEESQFANG